MKKTYLNILYMLNKFCVKKNVDLKKYFKLGTHFKKKSNLLFSIWPIQVELITVFAFHGIFERNKTITFNDIAIIIFRKYYIFSSNI
jgi:hypothetical protein